MSSSRLELGHVANHELGHSDQSSTDAELPKRPSLVRTNSSMESLLAEVTLRDKIHTFVKWDAFEYFMVLVVVVSCVVLALDAPYSEYARDNPDILDTFKIIEYVMLGIFSVECILFFIALGPIGYFKSMPQVFALAIVVGGVVGYAMDNEKVSGVANALRAARPLQALSIFPSIRAILKCFAYATWSLTSVLSIVFFFLVLFGLTAMQLFGTALRHRCMYNGTVIAPKMYDGTDFYYYNCAPSANGQQCVTMFAEWDNRTHPLVMYDGNGTELPLTYDINGTIVPAVEYEAKDEAYWFEMYGNTGTLMEPKCEDEGNDEEDYTRYRKSGDVYHFDYFGWTVVMIYQCITAVGWSDMMYRTQDAVGWYAVFYFALVEIVGQWVILNLAVAVLGESYNSVMEDVEAEEKEKRRLERQRARKIKRTLKTQKSNRRLGRNDPVVSTSSAVESTTLGQKILARLPQPLPEEEMAKRKPLRDIVLSKAFINGGTVLILTNAGLMTAWTPYQSDEFKDAYDIFHWIFSAIFAVELVLRLAALGAYEYVQNPFRNFDGVLVCFTVIDLIQEGGLIAKEDLFTKGLRGFRVMRLIRPLSQIPAFKTVVVATFRSLKAINAIGVVLVAFLFMMAILGMNLLGGIYGDQGVGVHGVRVHFDNFVMALATIWYSVLTENWTGVMYKAYSSDTSYPVLVVVYFVFVITVGNFIILNMFLAVLLDFMAQELEDERNEKARNSAVEELHLQRAAKTLQIAIRLRINLQKKNKDWRNIAVNGVQGNNLGTLMTREQTTAYPYISGWEMAAYKTMWDTATDDGMGGQHVFRPSEIPAFLKLIGQPLTGSTNKDVAAEIIERIKQFDSDGDGKIAFYEFLSVVNDKRSMEVDRGYVDWKELDEDVEIDEEYTAITKKRQVGEKKMTTARKLAVRITRGVFGSKKSSQTLFRHYYLGLPLIGTTCGVLHKSHRIRQISVYLYYNSYYKAFVLFFILAAGSSSGAVFAQKRADGYRTDIEEIMGTDAFDACSKVLDVFFWLGLTSDITLRIIIGGLWVDPKRGYLRPSSTNPGLYWRVQDVLVAFFTFFALVFPMPDVANNGARVYMTVQSVRLLTLIPRVHRMKVMASSLMGSLPNVGMLLVAMMVILLAFGVMGVFMFGGAFGYCSDADGNIASIDVINNKTQCEDSEWQGYVWKSGHAPGLPNFDNVGYAMLALFQVMFIDGHSAIIFSAIDARGVDMQPDVESAYMPALLYFWVFSFVGALFFLNLIVGAICSTFDELVKIDSGMDELTEDQRRWVFTQRLLQSAKPKPVLKPVANAGIRYKCFILVAETDPVAPSKGSKQVPQPKTYGEYFSAFIMGVVIANLSAMLAYTKDTENENYTRLYSILSLFFGTTYLLEFVAKVAGLGKKQYWAEPWNRFDALLMVAQVVAAFSSAIVYLTGNGGSSLDIGFFRALRIFRLAKYSRSLRMIFMTVQLGTPALLNISALLYVILYVFAMLGMTLFGGFIQGDGCAFSIHAHFDTIFAAFETVFRLATGDSWSCLYLDAQRLEYPSDIDTPNIFFVHFYFILVMLASLLLISVFVGIIMEYYGIQSTLIVTQTTAEQFNMAWNKFDRQNTSYIPVDQMGRLILALGAPLSPLPPHRPPVEKKKSKKGEPDTSKEQGEIQPHRRGSDSPTYDPRWSRNLELDDVARLRGGGMDASSNDYVRNEFGKVDRITPGSPTEIKLRLFLHHLNVPVRQGKVQYIEVICALAECRDGQPIPRTARKVRQDLLTAWPEKSPSLLQLPPQEGLSSQRNYIDDMIAAVTSNAQQVKAAVKLIGAVKLTGVPIIPGLASAIDGGTAGSESLLTETQTKDMPNLAWLTACADTGNSGGAPPTRGVLALKPRGEEAVTTSAAMSSTSSASSCGLQKLTSRALGGVTTLQAVSEMGGLQAHQKPLRYKSGGVGLAMHSGLMTPPLSEPPSESSFEHEGALLKAWHDLRGDFMSEDLERQLAAMIMLRKLLSSKKTKKHSIKDIKRVVGSSMVPRFVQFMQADETPAAAADGGFSPRVRLNLESAWVLDSVCTDFSPCGQLLVENGAVPVLVAQVRDAKQEVLAAQAMRLLGTIARSAPEHREVILMQGVMMALLLRLTPASSIACLRSAASALSSLSGFYHGGAGGTWALLASSLKVLPHLMRADDEEILLDMCRTLAAMTQEPKTVRHAGMPVDKDHTERELFKCIESVLQLHVLPRVVKLMGRPAGSPLPRAALRVAANIAAGDDHQTQAVVDAGALSYLMPLLLSPDVEAVKDSCWLVSNVLAGTDEQVQAVIDGGVMSAMVRLLGNTDHSTSTRQQAAYCIINVSEASKPQQVAHLAEVGCVKSLCDLLINDPVLPSPLPALNALNRLCKYEAQSAPAVALVDVYKLRLLQSHSSPEVQKRANKLLKQVVMSPAVLTPSLGPSRELLTAKPGVSSATSASASSAAVPGDDQYEEEPPGAELEVMLEAAWEDKWKATDASVSSEQQQQQAAEVEADRIMSSRFPGADPIGGMLSMLEEADSAPASSLKEDEVVVAVKKTRPPRAKRQGSSKGSSTSLGSSPSSMTSGFDALAKECLTLDIVSEAEYDQATDAIAAGISTEEVVSSIWRPRLAKASSLKRETTGTWSYLAQIRSELDLSAEESKQKTVKSALERCGLQPAATIVEDVENIAKFLELK